MSNEQSVKCATNTPSGVGADSSRPYPDIIKYTFSHYQICTFTSSHTHIHIINYVFPFHRTRISTLPNMCFHIIEYVYSFHRIRAFALPHTHIHITEYVHSHHRTHISATLFVGEYGYAGTINRTFAAANGWLHATSPLLYYNKLSP